MRDWRTSSTEKKQNKRWGVYCALTAAAVLAAALSLCLGSVALPLGEVLHALLRADASTVAGRIVLYSRLPRTLGCLTAGAALAAAGAVIQTVLDNPLAAPNIIGVNSGAGLAVALWGALMPGAYLLLPWAAFLGALGGVLPVLLIGERGGASRLTLVLAGIAVSAVFSGALELVLTLSPEALSAYADFRVGSFAGVTLRRLYPAAAVALLALCMTLLLSPRMDVLSLGTETAESLGLRVRPLRLALLSAAAALAGSAVSVAGLLGFVGLMVPHAARRWARGESAHLIGLSALGGAAFVTFCDLLSRLLFAPYELPAGALLSFVGGPFFLWLILRRRGGRSHA